MKTRAPAAQTTRALTAAALVVGISLPAVAQETSATTPSGWSFALTPYIWFAARAGYRHLKVDYEDGSFVWDVELSGPIVGATFRF